MPAAAYSFSGLPPSPTDSGFPSTLSFFLAQPIAIFLLDPLASRYLARPLRIAYVWAFVVASCALFRRAYLDVGMLYAPIPTLDRWFRWRWTVPMAVLVPKSLL